MPKRVSPKKSPKKETVWKPTQVQFLYRHKNGRYYVRTFASGKEKWTSLRTTILSIARNRMREHLDAAERQRLTGTVASEATGKPDLRAGAQGVPGPAEDRRHQAEYQGIPGGRHQTRLA